MLVVAFAAVVTEGVLVGWWTVAYRMLANDHARHLNSAKSLFGDSEELRQWHDRMRRKYEQAASRPWLSVTLDPPPPKP
jgi:hypothetical protein